MIGSIKGKQQHKGITKKPFHKLLDKTSQPIKKSEMSTISESIHNTKKYGGKIKLKYRA